MNPCAKVRSCFVRCCVNTAVVSSPSSTIVSPTRAQRLLLWGALLALLVVAQSLLLALTINFESARAQDDVDSAAAEAALEVRRELLRVMQSLQALALEDAPRSTWASRATALLAQRSGLERLELRDDVSTVVHSADAPFAPPLFAQMPRTSLAIEAELACTAARRASAPLFSRSYFVPLPGGRGVEVMDLCIPLQREGRDAGYVVGSVALHRVLEAVSAVREARRHEFSLVEGDGTRLARAGLPRGAGVYVAERVVDVPGSALQLRANSAQGRPSLIPNLTTALVLGLSFALFALVLLLARDVRRRARVETALAESLAFRKAMEDSLSTGLRARDLSGVVTYANPAFCSMVGFSAEELQAAHETPPYWPPEAVAEYASRQQQRMAGTGGRPPAELRGGFETLFVRKNGERFPVMIYETPLLNSLGQHTGWMSAVLDLSAQRRVEELARQQQDRLQATARLATVGEMASLLSHELNQPLAAIASYASGSLNLLAQPDPTTPELLQQALERIAEQAERAGRVIKSVHDFVRRREQHFETISARQLIESVLPLVRLQARKSGTRIEIHAPENLRVRCDRTMLEQVLLNLARNGIQAMETDIPSAERVLTIKVQAYPERWVAFSVLDAGPGVAADVAAKLFTPFFTTRAEGMGLGLSLCRTVIEQHGGSLDFKARSLGTAGQPGAEFRFTLPSARSETRGQARAETSETSGSTTAPQP
jgi:two-component system, LuxR family, sensor histidine kinase DctS